MKYLFVLGRDSILSLAEIIVYFKSRNISFKINQMEKDAVLIESDFNPKKLMHDLGGTVKIAKILFEGNTIEEITEQINGKELIEWMNEKFCYALNFYGREFKKKRKLEEFFKKRFNEEKKKAVYRKSKKHKKVSEKVLSKTNSSPTQVHSWNLIKEESDFILFNSNKLFFGLTVECFNPKELKRRDKDRPAQKQLHSISLRLARILINLSGAKENQVLLDPFCGIGSVLQEAMFNGINVLGIELNDETAGMARKNLEWFEKKYKTGKKWVVIQGDSAFVKETLQGKKFDAIATEPFLGPLLKKKPREKEAKKIIKDLGELFFAFFKKLSLITRKQKIAIILPAIKCTNGKTLELSEHVFSQYFDSVNPISEFSEKAFPYNYMEKESNIGRKIYLLERKQ
jgi:tRNA G10  N-methylase Trm11